MITIQDKHLCCGCGVCSSSCPVDCIRMESDAEGFLYPVADAVACVDCGKCERVCPIRVEKTPSSPRKAFAAKNNDTDVQLSSSSGGIFTVIAEKGLSLGGVIFGAAFDNDWKLCHIYVDDKREISRFRGSKYLQSDTSQSFQLVKRFLKEGRHVIFSGTPCQVAGLKSFLDMEYEKLLTVEIACHGVPSPKFFYDYLKRRLNVKDFSCVTEISFRDKSEDWVHYHFVVKSYGERGTKVLIDERASSNLYMQSFLKNYNMRPSCYQCAFKSGRSSADITLADFWGVWDIMPAIYDKMGVSAVFINTNKGESFWQSLDVNYVRVDNREVFSSNSSLNKSPDEPKDRLLFWEAWQRGDYKTVKKMCIPPSPSIIHRILNRIIK